MKLLKHPPSSPGNIPNFFINLDLNPIEPVWNDLKRRVDKRRLDTNSACLEKVILEEWDNVTNKSVINPANSKSLIIKGYRTDITKKDVGDMEYHDKCEKVTNDFELAWNKASNS